MLLSVSQFRGENLAYALRSVHNAQCRQCESGYSALRRWISQCTMQTVHRSVHTLQRWITECRAMKVACRAGWSPLMIAILNPAGAEHGTNTPVERITRAVREKP